MVYIILFIFGSVIGSFLNVCIYRLPRNEKIGLSRSRCPYCKNIIRWYDNIPFISYILLRGRCRYCGKHISFRYFVVEFLTAGILCILWWKFAAVSVIAVLVYFVFVCFLIIASFIDLEFFIIPDVINFSGIILGLAAGACFPFVLGEKIWYMGLLRSFLGVVIGGGSLFLVAVSASAVLKKEAMGMGDVKLLAMIGSFIGWQWALFTVFWSSLLGSVFGIGLIMLQKANIKAKIPYGPYLSLGAFISLLFGPEIMKWYLDLL